MTEHDDQAQGENYRPPSGVPARGYTWEPFQPGNQVALTHGAYSDRLIAPRAREIAQGMQEAGELPDYLAQPRYRGAVMDLATALARRERLEVWLEATAAEGVPPELSENGEVRSAAAFLAKVERSIERLRDRLGLSPLAAARLGKDVATQQATLSQLWAAMDAQESADGGGDDS